MANGSVDTQILTLDDLREEQMGWACQWIDYIYKAKEVDYGKVPRRPPFQLYKYHNLDFFSKKNRNTKFSSMRGSQKQIYIKNRIKERLSGFLSLRDPRNFNDPLDSVLPPDAIYHILYGDKHCGELGLSDFKEAHKNSDFRNKLRITCLTESNDNPLMWSHYADSHKGICIGYDISVYLRGKKENLLVPVIYTDDTKSISRYIKYEDDKIEVSVNVDTQTQAISTMLKRKDWSYEKEWRFVKFKNDDTGPDKFVCPVSAVYIGLFTPEPIRKIIIRIAKEKGIPIFISSFSHDGYRLEMKPIN